MTGPEHYREAERLLNSVPANGEAISMQCVTEAQVHATLALAAATVDAMHLDLAAKIESVGVAP